ncbi:hypothetical protein Q1695_003437 [Nippostrongylus brasiliensis]|nr:hypothetical protein Q1695_003437 [Nippostrongylus brasiliensis]
MSRRPSDRRGYIAQPSDRSPTRHSKKRRSVEPRGRSQRRSPPPPHFEHHRLHHQLSDRRRGDPGFDNFHFDESRRDFEFNPRNEIPRGAPIPPPVERVREGIVFEYMNYYEFLQSWLDESNRILLKKDRAAVPKGVDEQITPTTRVERSRIILPAGVHDRNEFLHCDMIIAGLPPSVFFGSGFGHKASLARAAAAKDLVDKCLRVGLITEELHASIGNHPFFKKRDLPPKDYDLAVDALVDLDSKWPWDLNTARELEPEILDRLKDVFDSVMNDIYFRGRRERPRNNFVCEPITHGPMDDEKAEFCRVCELYGHSERYCTNDRARGRERVSTRAPLLSSPPSHSSRPLHHYDSRVPDEIFDRRSSLENDRMNYTPDELAEKIARQREELLRQEMLLRQAEPVDKWHTNGIKPQPSSYIPPLIPSRGSMSGLNGTIQPLLTPISPPIEPLEPPVRPIRGDDMRVKLEAKAQKLEEEKRLKQKEEELERRMQRELEEKRLLMEEEIRKKVQLEERAKLQMELARANQPVYPPLQSSFPSIPQQNYSTTQLSLPSTFSSTFPSSSLTNNVGMDVTYSSAPDFEMEEIRRLIKETEEKLVELQRSCRETELTSVFKSRAFQMITELGDNAHMLDRSQKQMLLRELKELLSRASEKDKDSDRKRSERRRSRDRSRDRNRSRDRYRGSRMGGNRDRSSHRRSRSRSRSPKSDSRKHSKEQGDHFEAVRIQVGGATLRNLSISEQRHLKEGDVVVAQDMKTGKWTTAHIAKVSGERATLSIGNTTWKKDVKELYKEVPEWCS